MALDFNIKYLFRYRFKKKETNVVVTPVRCRLEKNANFLPISFVNFN